MALIQNNLIINKNSERYSPFLVNLLSGRRRRLDGDEFSLVCSMLEKENITNFNEAELALYDKLTKEKQFVDDTLRSEIEQKMVQSGMFNPILDPSVTLDFTISLTMDCNMQCYYCYEKNYKNKSSYINRDYIDAIYDFYAFCRKEYGANGAVGEIGITGGEPLISEETAKLVKYISKKWSDSKITIITNGKNLLKYYDELPIGESLKVHLSLDGLKETHLNRRYSGKTTDGKIYDDIILGIKRLLSDNITVRLQAVIDKNNYQELPQLHEFLLAEDILSSANCGFVVSQVNDFSNQFAINEEFNTKHEISKMQKYLSEHNTPYDISYFGLSRLYELIGRPVNEPYIPKHFFCNTGFLSKYFFSPDGKIYFCNCFDEDKGIVGTYFPNVSINEDATLKLAKRSVINHDKCQACSYKFVCLGGCPKISEGVGEDMTCGVFLDSEIMDNLEYNYLNPQIPISV